LSIWPFLHENVHSCVEIINGNPEGEISQMPRYMFSFYGADRFIISKCGNIPIIFNK
jgi:hypothetical protein